MRRIVRPPKSQFKVGQRVRVEGGPAGDYLGVVTQTHSRLTKSLSAYDDSMATKPGVTVKVDWWDGSAVGYDMSVEAWDIETEVCLKLFEDHPVT